MPYGQEHVERPRATDGVRRAPGEKPELWEVMVGHWPAYDEDQAETGRDIPVVVLERVDEER